MSKRLARIDRDVFALREQVASLHRTVAFLQEIGCVLCLVFIALLAVGAFVIVYVDH